MDPTTCSLLDRLGFGTDEVEAAAGAVAALHAPARLGEVRALHAAAGSDAVLAGLASVLCGGQLPAPFVGIGQLDDGVWHEEDGRDAPLALLVLEGTPTLPIPGGDGDWQLCLDCSQALAEDGGSGTHLWVLTELARLARAGGLATGQAPLATTVAVLLEATRLAQAVYREVFHFGVPEVFDFADRRLAPLVDAVAAARDDLAGRFAAAAGRPGPGPDRLIVVGRGSLSSPAGVVASAAFGSVPVAADGDVALVVVPAVVAAVVTGEQTGGMEIDDIDVLALDTVLPAAPAAAVAVAAKLWQPGAADLAYGRLDEAVAAARALHAA